jgi:hypothetical protein
MEQRDYILREIEKIGMVIRAIRQKLFGSPDDLAITVDNQAETLREMLLDEAYLDLDELVTLDSTETERYLAGLKGFNTENIELLAQTLSDIGLNDEAPASRPLLEKALQLYDICSLRDRTFSFEREAAVIRIKEVLKG